MSGGDELSRLLRTNCSSIFTADRSICKTLGHIGSLFRTLPSLIVPFIQFQSVTVHDLTLELSCDRLGS